MATNTKAETNKVLVVFKTKSIIIPVKRETISELMENAAQRFKKTENIEEEVKVTGLYDSRGGEFGEEDMAKDVCDQNQQLYATYTIGTTQLSAREPSHQAPAQNQVAIDAQFNEELRKIISEEINKVFFGPDFQQRLKDHLLSAVDATWTAKLAKEHKLQASELKKILSGGVQPLNSDYYSTYLAGKINNMLNSVKSIAQVPSSPFGFK